MAVTSELTISAAQPVDVSIDGPPVYRVSGGGEPVRFPERITSDTTYHVEAGQVRVSVRRAGLELATDGGKPLYLSMPSDAGKTVAAVSLTGSVIGGDVSIRATDGDMNVFAAGDLIAFAGHDIDIETFDQGTMTLVADLAMNLTTASGDIVLSTLTTAIKLQPAGDLQFFDGAGLDAASRPALATATDEASVVAQFNLLRTALIALGVATDGD